MSASRFISVVAWLSAIVLAWSAVLKWVDYGNLVIAAWVFFIVVGIGAGIMSMGSSNRY